MYAVSKNESFTSSLLLTQLFTLLLDDFVMQTAQSSNEMVGDEMVQEDISDEEFSFGDHDVSYRIIPHNNMKGGLADAFM